MKNEPVTVVSNQEVAPGCFCMLVSGLPKDFSPQPGQFIMLKIAEGYDPLLRRPFAASRKETATGIGCEIIYKVVGRGTQMMSEMRPGRILELLGPLGKGFRVSETVKSALLVAGGMGIVPLRGLPPLLQNRANTEIHLFMGAKTSSEILFAHEFAAIGIHLHLATEDGTVGYQGLVTDLLGRFLKNLIFANAGSTICIACGPPAMLATVARVASPLNIPCQVSLEANMACGIGACLGCVVKRNAGTHGNLNSHQYARVCVEGPVFDAGEIAWET